MEVDEKSSKSWNYKKIFMCLSVCEVLGKCKYVSVKLIVRVCCDVYSYNRLGPTTALEEIGACRPQLFLFLFSFSACVAS